MIGVDDQTCEKCSFRHSETGILTWSIVMWNWASKRMKKISSVLSAYKVVIYLIWVRRVVVNPLINAGQICCDDMQHMLKHLILPCVFTSKIKVALFYMVFALHLNVAWTWGTLTVSMFFVLLIFRACVFIVFSQSKLLCGEFSMVFPIWIQDIVFVSTSVLMTKFFLW